MATQTASELMTRACCIRAGAETAALGSGDVNNEIIDQMLRRLKLETDPLAWWNAIAEQCAAALGAQQSAIYVFDAGPWGRRLRRVGPTETGRLGYVDSGLYAKSRHPAARAVRLRGYVEGETDDRSLEVAVPIFGHPEPSRDTEPLAALMLRFSHDIESLRPLVRSYLTRLVHHIWPLASYASIRHSAGLGDPHRPQMTAPTRLDDVFRQVLEPLRQHFGCEFAIISLVHEGEIRAEASVGSRVTPAWLQAARHPLDSTDIQADVVRTGRTEIIAGWDPRLDPEIFADFQHGDLVRAFLPLGRIGTIEAGFDPVHQNHISGLLVDVLERYASDVTAVVQNALVADQNELLAELHRILTELQETDSRGLLRHLTAGALYTLMDRSDLVICYPIDEATGEINPPIYSGSIIGDASGIQLPVSQHNVVTHTLETGEPYFSSDAQLDPLLVGQQVVQAKLTGSGRAPVRTFTERQQIHSLAAVPIKARGQPVGVLCLNYRAPRLFSQRERQRVEVFARLATGVFTSNQMAVAQERQRLQDDLHDRLKSTARGLTLLNEAALRQVQRGDLSSAQASLEAAGEASWHILQELHTTVSQLSMEDQCRTSCERVDLRQLLEEELQRLARHIQATSLEMNTASLSIAAPMAEALRLIVREAVFNAVQHARARNIVVRANSTRDRMSLQVVDDGIGFDPRVRVPGHRGRESMERRAAAMGGSLLIDSRVGNGTVVYVELPLLEVSHGRSG